MFQLLFRLTIHEKCFLLLVNLKGREVKVCGNIKTLYVRKVHSLTHSFPMHPFSTPWKHQKTVKVFWPFQGTEKGCTGNEWVNSIISTFENLKNENITDEQSVWEYLEHEIKKFQRVFLKNLIVPRKLNLQL